MFCDVFPSEVCPFFGLLSSSGEVTCVACTSQGTSGSDGLSFFVVVCSLSGDWDASSVFC